MPYRIGTGRNKKCIYKKGKNGKKIGCTTGSVKKYMAALHANVKESNFEKRCRQLLHELNRS